MQVCVFLDLDDTLFQTLAKCPAEEPRRAVAFRRDGAPLSFMTERQARMLQFLDAAAVVIPVTARNLDAFRRVDVPFRSLAVLDFGAVVLRADGTLDPAWDARIRPQARAVHDRLPPLLTTLQAFISRNGLGVNARVIADFDMALYLVMKHPDGDVAALDTIRSDVLPTLDLDGFFVHANGNNLAIVPRFLGKERAVAHILETHFAPPVLSIGMGDSVSDAAFLQQCDLMMMPSGSQLAALCLRAAQEIMEPAAHVQRQL